MDAPFDAARDRHRAGHLKEAAAGYRAILATNPDHARARAGLGVIALQSGDPRTAKAELAAAAALAPDDALILNNLGNAAMALEELDAAEAAFDAAARADPADPNPIYNRAVARHRQRRLAEARADYEATLHADPTRLDAAVNLAALHRELEDPGAGIRILETAIDRAGNQPDALLALAELHETVGNGEAAAEALNALPESRRRDARSLMVRARLHLRAGEAEAGLNALNAMSDDTPPQAVRQALGLRGLLLDRAGRTEEAFEAFRDANAAMAASHPDSAKAAARYRHRIESYRTRLRTPPAALPSPEPLPFELVFFCGFPRSGTTLMEQVLDAHPATVTTGEDSPLQRLSAMQAPAGAPDGFTPADVFGSLSPSARESLREEFVGRVEARHGDIAGRMLIDKLPLNLVELGVIARLFPEARILVALRDPRDCVLSAFMQQFRLNDAMACLLTLEGAASTYSAVFDLYEAQKPAIGLPTHEYKYEDLIDDFDWDDPGRARFPGARLGRPLEGLSRGLGRALHRDPVLHGGHPVVEPPGNRAVATLSVPVGPGGRRGQSRRLCPALRIRSQLE